jgi:tetratricopeptide (TPR) repeat protein
MNDWHDAERRVELAGQFFQQRKWSDALRELQAATRINPYNAAWFHNMGLVLDELGRFEEAVDAYRKADRLKGDDLETLSRLASDLHRVGRPRGALRTLRRVSGIDPSHEPAYCEAILIHAELGEHEQAEEMFYLARLYKDQCPRCYDYMGRSLVARGRFERAVFCFQKCLDLDANAPDVVMRLAQAYWKKGENEKARRHFLADLRANPGRLETLLDMGDLLAEMGLNDEAGEKFRRAIELSPEHPASYFRYGRWLIRRGKIDDAQAAFEKTLRLDPTHCGPNLELAKLAHRRGDELSTLRYLRAEHLRRPRQTEVLLGLGNLWMDVGELRTAIACLGRLLHDHPDNIDAWLNLAVAQFLRRDYRQGIRSCRQALCRDQNNRTAMFNTALAYERLGKYERALHWTRRALKLQPRDPNLQRLENRLGLLRWLSRILAVPKRLMHAMWRLIHS